MEEVVLMVLRLEEEVEEEECMKFIFSVSLIIMLFCMSLLNF